jgi:hypothetical protein
MLITDDILTGNIPFEKNEISASQIGHSSTG